MDILVCMAQVPATDIKAKIASDGKSLDTADVKFVINPYDEFAIEEALRTREKSGGEVTLISIGPDRVPSGLREGLALGADKAVHIQSAGGYMDAFNVARALSAQIKTMAHDLIFMGKIGVGYDQHQVGAMVAELLGLPHVAAAVHLELQEGKAVAKREIEGATEVMELPVPAVITTEKGLNEPRYASLKGIMAAKKKPIDTVPLESLVPDAKPILVIESMELPPAKQRGKLIDAEDPAAAAKELVRLLKEEAKVL
ncbi:MAG TPA: electron transfer flavoprotein subunit beta/FixA family protein [Thermoanaerobaculia bacterium]|nr:electron transfer flavoprotein subunit beta/FixA family protein [Thermoanaerobaculia bacterium]HUM30005.1 electron transfer flavoprotein subunit beta/FixA family protein [Thermoanaerobaculia bacterium]HXK68306.1 electron transfer flavoprotein subunit beta/FixA family protein [Thermoanaerobaculia bacterium]